MIGAISPNEGHNTIQTIFNSTLTWHRVLTGLVPLCLFQHIKDLFKKRKKKGPI